MNPLEHVLESGSGVNGKEQSTSSSICQACGGFLYKCKLYGHIPLKEYMNKTFSCGCRMTENGPDTFCKDHTPIREDWKRNLKAVIEHLKDETYHSFEDIIADLEAVVAG